MKVFIKNEVSHTAALYQITWFGNAASAVFRMRARCSLWHKSVTQMASVLFPWDPSSLLRPPSFFAFCISLSPVVS